MARAKRSDRVLEERVLMGLNAQVRLDAAYRRAAERHIES